MRWWWSICLHLLSKAQSSFLFNCSSPSSWSSPSALILAYLWCLLERILQLLRKPAMWPQRMCCLWFLLLSGLIDFSRGRGRPPTKKVIKSSEFIDDEAEERLISSLVCFWIRLTVFIHPSCDNSDSDMKSVMSLNMSASKVATATPYVFSLASTFFIFSTYVFSAILEVVPLLKLSSLLDHLRKLTKSAWSLLFIHVFSWLYYIPAVMIRTMIWRASRVWLGLLSILFRFMLNWSFDQVQKAVLALVLPPTSQSLLWSHLMKMMPWVWRALLGMILFILFVLIFIHIFILSDQWPSSSASCWQI